MKLKHTLFGLALTALSLFSCSGKTVPDPLIQQTSDKTHDTLADDKSMVLTWKDTRFSIVDDTKTEVSFLISFKPKYINDIGKVTYAFLTYTENEKSYNLLLNMEAAEKKNGYLIYDSDLKEDLIYTFPFVIPTTINGKDASENNLSFIFSYHNVRYTCPYTGDTKTE